MQLLVRNLAGATSVLQLSPDSTVGELKAALQVRSAVLARPCRDCTQGVLAAPFHA